MLAAVAAAAVVAVVVGLLVAAGSGGGSRASGPSAPAPPGTASPGAPASPASPSGATPSPAPTSSGGAVGSGPASTDTSPSTQTVDPGAPYLLSLGDSLGFGFQQRRFVAEQLSGTYAASRFPGYTQPLAQALRDRQPSLQVTNLSCPGETTTTMIDGGCPFAVVPLHTSYAGPQLAAAVSFLERHDGPGTITVSIGANDVLGLLRCTPQPSCASARVPAVDAALRSRLTVILGGLRAAAPHARLLVLRPYNPFAVDRPDSDITASRLAGALESAARSASAQVVDAFAVFNDRPGEHARLCRLTLMCTSDRDVHPSDPGYARLAELLAAA